MADLCDCGEAIVPAANDDGDLLDGTWLHATADPEEPGFMFCQVNRTREDDPFPMHHPLGLAYLDELDASLKRRTPLFDEEVFDAD
jgi:hypothetical protein